MFWLLIFMSCLCLTTAAVCSILKRNFEQTVGGVMLAAILAAYVLALVDLLPVAAALLPAAALASGVFLFIRWLRYRRAALPSLTPGLLVFCVLCAVCWWNVRGRLFISWDDFSHWGTVLKDMYCLDRLYSLEGVCTFPDYPPAMPLMEYLLVRLAPEFREDLALYAMGMFSTSLLVYPLGYVRGRRLPRLVLCLFGGGVLFILPTVFFFKQYAAISVDGIMGILLAYACLSALYEKDTRLKGLLSGAALAVLALTKGAGFPFALMGAVLAFFIIKTPSVTGGRRFWGILYRLQPMLLLLCAQFGWSLHRTILDIGSKWSSDEPALVGLKALFSGEPEWRMQVIRNYISELLTNNGYSGLHLTYPALILLIAVFLAVAVFLLPRGSRGPALWCGFGLLGCVFVYSVSLLYSYLFLFTPDEAMVLASVSRYLGTPATALLVATGALIFFPPAELSGHRQLFGICAGVLFWLLCAGGATYTFAGTLLQAPLHAAQTQHDRYLAKDSAAVIRTVSDGSDVYIICSQDSGAVGVVEFELIPVAIPPQNSGIACLYPEEWYGGYNVRCSPQEWSDILYNGPYRYVYLYQADSYFNLGYRELFEDEAYLTSGSLLEIIRHEDGTVTLRGLILGNR